MSELKPCPFCGGMTKVVQCDDEGNVRGEEYESNPWSGLGYRVMHESDDCPISTGEDGYNLIYDSREEAESHWNRRADECDRDELLKVADEIDRIEPEPERTCKFVHHECRHPGEKDPCGKYQDCEWACAKNSLYCSSCDKRVAVSFAEQLKVKKYSFCPYCDAKVVEDD